MQKTKDIKMYFYVDESGDPMILGRKGKNLLVDGNSSKTFISGCQTFRDQASFI